MLTKKFSHATHNVWGILALLAGFTAWFTYWWLIVDFCSICLRGLKDYRNESAYSVNHSHHNRIDNIKPSPIMLSWGNCLVDVAMHFLVGRLKYQIGPNQLLIGIYTCPLCWNSEILKRDNSEGFGSMKKIEKKSIFGNTVTLHFIYFAVSGWRGGIQRRTLPRGIDSEKASSVACWTYGPPEIRRLHGWCLQGAERWEIIMSGE